MSSEVLAGTVREGDRHGRLVAVGVTEKLRGGRKVICKCDCGMITSAHPYSLTSGNTKSCGCLKGKTPRVDGHGMVGTKEYRAWGHMWSRCTNPKVKSYRNYGGRGISVCDRWISFRNFFDDMGKSPSAEHSIDRVDNDGDYNPGNCRWATVKEQRRNKRDNRILVIDGERRTLAEWAEKFGVLYKTAHNRLRMGWSPREAVCGKA